MHCGGNEGIPYRLELGREWYNNMGYEGIKLNFNPKEIYKVEV